MKINEVEAAVGVTKKNIRFYEAEGLLRPRRDAGNGYRDYTEADVDRLRRIKLLRKLDVPLAEIAQMLDGSTTLAEGMQRHGAELEARRRNLAAAIEFCGALGRCDGMLAELDVAASLQALERREQQGVKFVNVQKVDRRRLRYQGALVGAALFIGMMLLVICLIAWGYSTDPSMPLPLLWLFIGIPALCILCVLVVLAQRFAEIRKGEEDDYSNY